MTVRQVLGVLVATFLTLVIVFALGPMACNTAASLAPVANRSFDGRVEAAAERGARRAIKPMHDESMQAHRVAQDSLNGIASCIDCKDKKAASTTHHVTTATTRKDKETTVTTTTTKATEVEAAPATHIPTYECGMKATYESAVEAAKHTNVVTCGPKDSVVQPTTKPCDGCNEHHEQKQETRKEEKRDEPCGKNLGHWFRRSCNPKPKTDNCEGCSKMGGSRAR